MVGTKNDKKNKKLTILFIQQHFPGNKNSVRLFTKSITKRNKSFLE
jgi:hypothetical protein